VSVLWPLDATRVSERVGDDDATVIWGSAKAIITATIIALAVRFIAGVSFRFT
jgi:hypothetical protein